ncbi:MAG: HlyD family efflux transporter periplasmic adaptor subunit [Chloroflexi bacterium]|jgi:HlyD family secretion protein|nr:HlyD family efflux transporter periplasmic adaptor subunit [Chloroflexota bacterium]
MKKLLSFGLSILLLWIGGCTSTTVTRSTPAPTTTTSNTSGTDNVDNNDSVRAEGVVEPARSVVLRAEKNGLLADVLVAEGKVVEAGEILLQFDTTEADLAVQQAEAALMSARTQLAMTQAGPRTEDIAVLEAQLGIAQAVISQSVALRQGHYAGGAMADIAEAQAQLADAEAAYQEAQEAHQETLQCYDVSQPDGSSKEICPTLGTFEEMARYQEQAAYAGLLAAQANLEAIRGAAQAEGSELTASEQSAIAQRDVMLAKLAALRAGSSPEAIAAAKADVRTAQAELETAQALRERGELRAPFAGVVTSLSIKHRDAVAAGDALLTLATLDALQVRTQDLTELDIAHIEVGQPAAVTMDAQPNQPLLGRIDHIEQQSTLYLGDVVYPVIVAFETSPPPWLRWGMTAQVEKLNDADDLPASPDNVPPPGGDRVIAEAVIQPAHWSNISFVRSGKISKILVAPGDEVTAGQVLIRLDDTHARLALQEADAALSATQAQLALAEAAPQETAIQTAEAQLAVAAHDLDMAQAQYQQLVAGGTEAEEAAAQAQLDAARAARREAEAYLQWAEDGGDAEKARAWRRQLEVIEQEIAAAEAQLEALPGTTAAQLRAAQAGIAVAEAQHDVAQAQLDLARAGSTTEEIAIAKAAVRQAEVAVATAEAALDRTVLRAPFAGTVIKVPLAAGDLVAPGQTAIVLATLDQWQAQTTNLQELSVVDIEEGQSTTVTIDALPDATLVGAVTQIGLESVEYLGDTTYPVTITLEDSDYDLYWGMTAVVEISAP